MKANLNKPEKTDSPCHPNQNGWIGKRGIRKGGLILAAIVGALMAAPPCSAHLADNAMHPAFDIQEIPMPDMYRNMGIGFLSDGRMVILTTGTIGSGEIPNPDPNSCVFIVEGAAGSKNIQVTKVASDFRQPSGLNIVNDKIYVSDRDAFYSIPMNSGAVDPAANKTKIMDWPFGAHWHHWVFCPIFANGKFYAPYSGSIRRGGPSDVPATDDYSGAFLQWDPDGSHFAKICGGLRSPNGANINAAGEMFVVDNQGSWLPADAFMQMKPGKFYGHRQTPPNAPNWAESLPYQPPAVWIPYPSAIAGGSNSQPVYVDKGTFAGQWFDGDVNGRGLLRFSLEKVAGDYQGAVFHLTNGMGIAATNRMAWGPDGALYTGSLEKVAGNWPANGLAPMYRISQKPGITTFEMLAIHSFRNGFEIEFTQPVDKASVVPANFSVKQWHYSRGAAYGCCKEAEEPRTISEAKVSEDGKRVFLSIPGLKTMDYEVYFKLGALKSSTGSAPWDNEAWYTLNNMSDQDWASTVNLTERNSTSSRLEASVHSHAAGPGNLVVRVDLKGGYSISLRSVAGAVLRRSEEHGPVTDSYSPGPGLYILEIRQGADALARKVIL